MPPTSPETKIQYYPLGDTGLVLQFGDTINEDTYQEIRAVSAWLDSHPLDGFVEYVPAYTSITIYYQPWILRYDQLVTTVQEMLHCRGKLHAEVPSPIRCIPVYYGGTTGADLDYVAAFHQMDAETVITLHTEAEYRVYMMGFIPGFAYMGGLDERLATPRKQQPSTRVPKGSVGIAGTQTGIYPLETPGGWQIIGQTPLALFDSHRAHPFLLKMGDIVRFTSITEDEFTQIKTAGYEH